MMKSSMFSTDMYKKLQRKIKDFLNSQEEFLSDSTARSTRAVGDAIEGIIGEHFESILGKEVCSNYSSNFARRAMADLAFEDNHGLYYVVDVKTHRRSTKFNMPNLTSVERLSRFYEDDKNHFVILMVSYDIQGVQVVAEEVTFVPIEFLAWDCLTIGALGWGQIQIANANIISINSGYSRRNWMLELCDTLFDFYPKEIAKIDRRIEHFKKMREQWEERPD